ncbi:unnamed protein product, partial [marine sediment metagenome]
YLSGDKGYVLFVDDDVLFSKQDLLQMWWLRGEYGVVSVLPRQEGVSRYWIKKWKKSNKVELHFSLWDWDVLKSLEEEHLEALKLLSSFEYGGEFYYLTWLLDKMGVGHTCLDYEERPYHLFMLDKYSSWRKASLKDWNRLGEEFKKLDDISQEIELKPTTISKYLLILLYKIVS